MKRIITYRNYVIWKDSCDNYRIEQPSGFFFDEPAANLKTAKKWIDCAVFELNNQAPPLKLSNPSLARRG